jgi:hypothetical protein
MQKILSFLKGFFSVLIRPQTYLNQIYLGLVFPLGLFYFIFLVTGFSLGLSLTILWIGFFILALVFGGAWILTLFERLLAIHLLRVVIPPVNRQLPGGSSAWDKFKAYLTNPATWKGLLYLALKFPLGTATFVIWITLTALTLALLLAPLVYPWVEIDFFFWQIHGLPAALIAFAAGLILAPVSLHISNGLAHLWGIYTRYMLGLSQPSPEILTPGQTVEAIPQ